MKCEEEKCQVEIRGKEKERTFGDVCFFFQAEDGIRDDLVTGVQTCALPIWTPRRCVRNESVGAGSPDGSAPTGWSAWLGSSSPSASTTPERGWTSTSTVGSCKRSEERRVGKEGR